MLIEIQCGNRPDSASDPCGERLIVSSEKIGEQVKCPRCGRPVEIREESTTGQPQSPPARPRQKPSGQAKTKNRSQRETTRNSKKAKPRSSQSKSASPRTKQKRKTEEQKNKTKSYEQVRIPVDMMGEMRLPKTQKEPEVAFDSVSPRNEDGDDVVVDTVVCIKCGKECHHGRCLDCGHIMPPFHYLYLPLTEIAIRPAGFQRWFMRTISDGDSIQVIVVAGHVLFTMLMAALVGFGVACMNGFFWGRDPGLWILIGAAVLFLFYLMNVLKARSFLRRPATRPGWYQRPFWNFVLMLARIFRWQGYDKRLKGRQIIKIKDRSFGDLELSSLQGLRNCQVLDLQKTKVTNESLKLLCGHKHLQCLVLRKTRVTAEGVFRLQQAIPRLWIWH